MNKPIGIFDSGVGGITVLKELINLLPLESFIYYADTLNNPYGTKTQDEIIAISDTIVKYFIKQECKLIVVACNTATAAAINFLRTKYQIPIIGLEPAIKPACLLSKTNNIGVLATEGTFRGNLFLNTSKKYLDYVKIHVNVAKGLVESAEKGIFNGKTVKNLIEKYLKPFEDKNIDQLVLGCTHYPFFLAEIKNKLGENINIVHSAEPVAKRTKDVLMINKMLNCQEMDIKCKFISNGNKELIYLLVANCLNIDINRVVIE